MTNIRPASDKATADLCCIFSSPAFNTPKRDLTWIEWQTLIDSAPDTEWRNRQEASLNAWRRRREREFGVGA